MTEKCIYDTHSAHNEVEKVSFDIPDTLIGRQYSIGIQRFRVGMP